MAKPGKRSARPGSKSGESEGPSRFFIMLLIAGLLLLVWMFIQGARMMTPATAEPPVDPPAAEETQ
ncbi:MAG: hypothetical protein ABR524_11325 [Thermoanaerobaculia bacterium]